MTFWQWRHSLLLFTLLTIDAHPLCADTMRWPPLPMKAPISPETLRDPAALHNAATYFKNLNSETEPEEMKTDPALNTTWNKLAVPYPKGCTITTIEAPSEIAWSGVGWRGVACAGRGVDGCGCVGGTVRETPSALPPPARAAARLLTRAHAPLSCSSRPLPV